MGSGDSDEATKSLPAHRRRGSGESAYLLVIQEESSRIERLPRNGVVLVGRDADADIRIDHEAVSRRHAKILVTNGKVTIADLESHNGTRLNDQRIDGARPLASGDMVAIANCVLVLHAPGSNETGRAVRTLAGPVDGSRASAAMRPSPSASPSRLRLEYAGHEIVVADPAMMKLYEMIARLALSDLSVLILGETGAGKENVAGAIHHGSRRASSPFVVVDCTTVPKDVAESVLFGTMRGAYTGALERGGPFEEARGGTVFLDEVGELPLDIQGKLLRVLESRTVQRLGEVQRRPVDVRIVAATNRDLKEEVAAGRFRRDLYFRLEQAMVVLPPLRDRPLDLVLLARRFLDAERQRGGLPPLGLEPDAIEQLCAHSWPGNVRELKNLMEWAAWVVPDGEASLSAAHLVTRLGPPPSLGASAGPALASSSEQGSGLPTFYDAVAALERRLIAQALDATGGNKTRAAARLKMPLKTLQTKCKDYGLG